MGVNLKSIIPTKEIELMDLSGKKIAIDAYNIIFQFLTIIRDRMTGEPLKDSQGRITSHLSGLFYRTAHLMEIGVKPVFVFDGEPPKFKKKTIEMRKAAKEEAKKKWEEALRKGVEAKTYAQAAVEITDDMIEQSKKLLEYMGIPCVQAPSEGEMQCAFMCKKGDVWASGSQDYDSLLTGSPRLVRNLSITGKRKLPRREAYIEIKPELIELENILMNLKISREQLIIMGILVGTDYNPGIKGIGPKTALKLVREHKTLNKVLEKANWNYNIDVEEIYNFFLNPPVTERFEIEWKEVDGDKIKEFMVEEHDFSNERVTKVIEKLQKRYKSGTQASLDSWFKK